MKKLIYLILTMILLGVTSYFFYNLFIIWFGEREIMIGIILFLCLSGGYGLGQFRRRKIYVDNERFQKGKPRFGKKK